MKRARITGACLGFVLYFLVFSSIDILAQGLFGTISGVITDSSGAVVPDATVKVTNVNTNIVVTLTTNSAGAYVATSLNPSVYDVEAAAKGFKKAVAKGIALEVNANPKIDLMLEVGATVETVEVTGENSPLLETQQSDVGQTVNQRELEDLPILGAAGRNVYSLLPLAAGVSQQTGCDGCGNFGNLRISGSRPRNDDNLLDGSTVTAPVFGGPAVGPSVDSIQEFRIEQNSMSAEYGKAGGAILIAVSKSGTNAFHGTAYEYNRNQKLDARNFFEDPTQRKNPFTYDEFGGSIGGPILKGRLFFFTDYQGIRSHGSGAAATNLVPDSNFRSGDLSALCTSGFDSSGNCTTASQQIHFPGTTTPVPFNKIPTGQISAISQNLLAIWPTSTTPGAVPGTDSLTLSSPGNTSLNRFDPRMDFNLSKSDHIFGVLHTQRGRFLGYNLIIGPAGLQTQRSSDYATTEGWTHTFNSTLVNDFRFGYLHRIGDRTPFGAGSASPSGFGISGIPNCLSSVPDTAGGTKCGTPGVSITGFSGISNSGMLYEPASTLQFSDVVNKLLGRHSLKTGAEFRHYSIDNYQPNGVVGQFFFTGSQTGNGFADFLFGVMNNGSVQVQNTFVSSRAWSYSFFVQDDFKLTPKLTLNLGLRWQYDQSYHEIHHGDAFFNPYTAQWEQFGVNAPDTTFDPSKKEFGPRVGFAWNARGGFVVRGGYGIMFPGSVGHGRAGDGQPGPNLLATTTFQVANWSNLPTVTSPDPSAITAPLPVNGNVSFSSWAPRHQYPTYVQLWNFTLEKQIGSNTIAQAGYVGSHGTHLPINYAYNICQQTPASTAQLGFSATTSPYCSPLAAQEAGIWNLVVNPGWWGLSSSIYHSLQAKVDHRFSHGFSLLTNFTWSKLIDDSSSDWGGFWSLDVLGQDFYNRRAERSVSAGDIPARLTVAPIVELPFGPGKRWVNNGVGGQVLGGWRMSAIYTISSGSPFGITDNSYGYCNAAHVLSDRPNMIGNPLPSGFQQTPQHWFDTSAFDFSGTCPAAGLVDLTGPSDTTKAFGNAPRYFSKIRNPGVNNFDFSVQKDFKIPAGEQTRLTFSADFFNLPNHPEFAEPNADPTVGNFGQISRTALNSRTIQLGLHLYF